jgi:hypothetical protein
MNFLENNQKYSEFNAILPNLKYKNNKIYFICKDGSLKIIKNNKTIFIKEYALKNISLTGRFYCMGIELNCTILEKEIENGLEINIKYLDNYNINRDHLKKFARTVEAKILNIDLDDDCESCSSEEYNLENEYKNKIGYQIEEEDEEYINQNKIIEMDETQINDYEFSKYEIDKFKDNL